MNPPTQAWQMYVPYVQAASAWAPRMDGPEKAADGHRLLASVQAA